MRKGQGRGKETPLVSLVLEYTWVFTCRFFTIFNHATHTPTTHSILEHTLRIMQEDDLSHSNKYVSSLSLLCLLCLFFVSSLSSLSLLCLLCLFSVSSSSLRRTAPNPGGGTPTGNPGGGNDIASIGRGMPPGNPPPTAAGGGYHDGGGGGRSQDVVPEAALW